MKAAVYHENGNPDVLKYEDVPDAVCHPKGALFASKRSASRVATRSIGGMVDEAAKGEFKVVIDRTFPLSQAAAAHAYIGSRQAVGRVLLIPESTVR
jgi:NADPH:quinone reductase-like Zn-dependent oxidoreductase